MDHTPQQPYIPPHTHGTIKRYLIGFVLSLGLTFLAFGLVYAQELSPLSLFFVLSALAVAQMIIQVRFFLHLGENEKPPYWNITAFVFMAIVVVILVGGTMWIMYHLNYHMMAM